MKRKAAVFTIVQNEPWFLPVWVGYYRRHFDPDDIFVLDHDSTDVRTREAANDFHRVPVHRAESFNHQWLRDIVKDFQRFLLMSYEIVLFAEADEIVACDPRRYFRGLAEFIERWGTVPEAYVRCTGYEVIHYRDREPPLDWSRPLLAQRHYWRRSEIYSKPLLSRVPLDWDVGFHRFDSQATPLDPPHTDVRLLHLHRVDFETSWTKTRENARRRWSPVDIDLGWGLQNRIADEQELERWFYTEFYDDMYEVQPIPEEWKEVV